MKVGFISTMEGLPWGGSEVLWSQAALRLIREGSEVQASVRRWPQIPRGISDLEAAGCHVHYRSPLSLGTRLRRKFRLPPSCFKWLRSFRPDLTIISLGIHLEGIEHAAICRSLNLPYVLLVQSADDARWPGDSDLALLSESYLGAAVCYFISRKNRVIVESQLAHELPSARLTRNPCNVDASVSLAWPDQNNGLRLACVGTLAPVQKSQDLIFQVLRESRWRQRSVSLSLFGKGQNEGSLKRLARMYGLENVVSFRGYTDNIQKLWAEHHALVLPSRHEGMPIVTVEAMLCGRVSIVTDIASNSEFVDDNVTGFLAPAASLPLVDEAMERAWMQRDRWREIGAAAGVEIRKRMPADPVGAFVENLKTIRL